jgi:hypothetical protein
LVIHHSAFAQRSNALRSFTAKNPQTVENDRERFSIAFRAQAIGTVDYQVYDVFASRREGAPIAQLLSPGETSLFWLVTAYPILQTSAAVPIHRPSNAQKI